MKFLSIVVSVSIVSLIGCGSSASHAGKADSAVASTPMAGAFSGEASGKLANQRSNEDPATVAPSVLQDRMIVRKADLSVRVNDIDKAEQEVSRVVRRYGGYIDSTTSNDLSSDHPDMTIAMRVPVADFDAILSGMEGLGVRISKTISSEDVTEQVVDLDARLKTMTAEEDTLRSLLLQARSMATIIALHDRLTDLRGTIESMAAQRKSLSKQAALSTITLTLQQAAYANPVPKDPNWMGQSWAEATTTLGGLLRGGVSLLIWILVFCPFWIPAIWLLIRLRRSARVGSAVG